MAIRARVNGELRQGVIPLRPAAATPSLSLAVLRDADVRHTRRQQDHGQLGRVRRQPAGVRASDQVGQVCLL